MTALSRDALERLATFDTPTICNALEHVMPATRGAGFTHRPLLCGFPDHAPIVGYARTATLRSKAAPSGSHAELRSLRGAYYRYVESGPRPSIVVIEALDGADAGYGAFWGEVHSAIHAGLGAGPSAHTDSEPTSSSIITERWKISIKISIREISLHI